VLSPTTLISILQKPSRTSRVHVAGGTSFVASAAENDAETVASTSDPTIEPVPVVAPAFTPDARELDDLAILSSDLACGGCGYQIAAYTTPPECPMCRERNWQPIPSSSGSQL
jgi:rubrerythrin